MKTGKELRAVLGLEGGNIPLLSVTWETGQLAVREQAKKSLKMHHGLATSKQPIFLFYLLFSNKCITEVLMFQRTAYITDGILPVDQTHF